MEVLDDYAGLRGRFYRWYIRRPGVARVVEAALWGSDFRPLYRHLAELADLNPGTTVLDAGLRNIEVEAAGAMATFCASR